MQPGLTSVAAQVGEDAPKTNPVDWLQRLLFAVKPSLPAHERGVGHVAGDDVVHTVNGGAPYTIKKPTTRQAFASEGRLASGNEDEKVFQTQPGAAFNRGVATLPPNQWGNSSAYYPPEVRFG